MTSIIAVFFFGFLILGMPIAFVLGVTSLVAILKLGSPGLMQLIPVKVYNGIDIYPLMAMPLLFSRGTSSKTNRDHDPARQPCALRLVGHLRGDWPTPISWPDIIFAGITGSAVADAAALGTLLIPAMQRAGVPQTAFAAALVAAAA